MRHTKRWLTTLIDALIADLGEIRERLSNEPSACEADSALAESELRLGPESAPDQRPIESASRDLMGSPCWLTKRELAEHLRLSTRWIEQRHHDGLPSQLVGGVRRY